MTSRRRLIGPLPRHAGGVGRQYDVWPLEEFDVWKQYDIACDVSEEKAPAKWIGFDGSQIRSRAWHEWHWQRGVDPESARPSIPAELRALVYTRDGHKCLHCGTTERLSLDHIHPYSLGGADTLENLQTLCRPCNSRKGVRV